MPSDSRLRMGCCRMLCNLPPEGKQERLALAARLSHTLAMWQARRGRCLGQSARRCRPQLQFGHRGDSSRHCHRALPLRFRAAGACAVPLNVKFKVAFCEDNQATIHIIQIGNSAQMMRTDTTQRTSLPKKSRPPQVSSASRNVTKLTEPFTSKMKWEHARNLIGVQRAQLD